jgi:hypothetical protein
MPIVTFAGVIVPANRAFTRDRMDPTAIVAVPALVNHPLPWVDFALLRISASLGRGSISGIPGGRYMARGAATRGKMAKAVAGADAIEIKATIPNQQIRQALTRFNLTTRNDEERLIYFFDTPTLDLNRAGIIARARRVIGDDHDSTVKFRPVKPEAVGQKWRKYRDFKIEADASEKGLVKSASFSMPVTPGIIKRVAGGRKPIASVFTEEQEAFLMSMARRTIDFSRLAVLGPLVAQRWQFEDPACPWPITAELWTRSDGKRLMEVSIKTPVVQAAAAVGGFMAFLAEVGAERDNNQQTKTRWALDYYAARLTRKPARKTATVKKSATVKKAGTKAARKR